MIEHHPACNCPDCKREQTRERHMPPVGGGYVVLSHRCPQTLDDLRDEFVRSAFAYPTPLPAELYDRAAAEGFEMTGYYVRGRANVVAMPRQTYAHPAWCDQVLR